MTNAEKYLTVSTKEFTNAIINTQGDIGGLYSLEKWLDTEAKPTLTEDERVILRNIQLYTGHTITIRRAGDSHLYISGGCGLIDFGQYNHLFQFIAERRRIFY